MDGVKNNEKIIRRANGPWRVRPSKSCSSGFFGLLVPARGGPRAILAENATLAQQSLRKNQPLGAQGSILTDFFDPRSDVEKITFFRFAQKRAKSSNKAAMERPSALLP